MWRGGAGGSGLWLRLVLASTLSARLKGFGLAPEEEGREKAFAFAAEGNEVFEEFKIGRPDEVGPPAEVGLADD